MTTDLLEHATRLLEREPTRCMSGELLHARARRDTGACISLNSFIALLAERPDRFAVMRAGPQLLDEADWSTAGPAVYQAAMAAVGHAAYLVMLAARPVDVAAAPDSVGSTVLADVHAALADVIGAADVDDNLRRAVCQAVHELECVRRSLERQS